MKYNTKNEDLYLWRCHPERVCINCIYFEVYKHTSLDSTDDPEHIKGCEFEMSCFNLVWWLNARSAKKQYIECILKARNCAGFEARE